MAKRTKIILSAALFALCASFAAAEERVATQLTAEVMDYDVETGDFKAQGNVTLKREGVTLTSSYGTANTQTQKARVWDKVHAFGTYNGEELDAYCAQLDADFSVEGGDFI
ncbi:MAG: LPS export ABC transporter periplasmic protein LptC, partial [Pyramidobacter sp.]|nr:LPS export ABC transporter periplasmic protein LptC [Pyramidobacter sp.]